MGKRSDFPRKPRDLYRTPYKAVVPLFAHLPQYGGRFYEPCGTDGRLVSYLNSFLENGKSGKDNAAWYRFEPTAVNKIEFYGRTL